VPAAVLVALYLPATAQQPTASYQNQLSELQVVLTQRHADLRNHAGEISFPGGRHDPADACLEDTALREAEEEIGLPKGQVAVLGSLTVTSTFVTNYAIHPFVGLISAEQRWRISPLEVNSVLEPSLKDLNASRTRTRLERRGFSFETDAFLLDEHLVWGATARIIEDLLERVEPLSDSVS
jgi:8-oxo-dGTP pyrophosphatase MutT (NUDIX family)